MPAARFSTGGLAAVGRVLQEAVASRAFPGAVLAVGSSLGTEVVQAHGRQAYDGAWPAVEAGTIYDLASLTKVVATTTLAMVLADRGRLDLDAPAAAWIPEFTGDGRERVTVAHLLSHSSGLDWWAPLYQELSGREAYLRRILSSPLGYEPGTRSVYSDLGFILLGEVLERAGGQSFGEQVAACVLEPLGLAETRYRPPLEWRPHIAPTEVDPWRGRLVHGEVHDENAFAMGGVAPQAGLFGPAPDLARFARALLRGGEAESGRLVSAATVARFVRRAAVPGSTRALGWDTPSDEGYSSAGSLLSRRAYGHTGFTGTSLWIDPDRDLFVILLSNRVHPSRQNPAIRGVRAAVADAVVHALEGQ